MSKSVQANQNSAASPDGKRLAGKVAVVTGASSGIGAATARALAGQGARVVLAARRVDRLEAMAREIEAAGGQACPLATDAAKPSDVKRMVEVAMERYGRLDFAVNNAGIKGHGAFLDMTVEDFDHTTSVNLRGVFLAMQSEIPAMLKSGGGAIVNVSSVAAVAGFAGMSVYAATKCGVIGLTKCVALEYAAQGIRINAIAPGLTATEMNDSAPQEVIDGLLNITPMRRIADAAEIASDILYLLAGASYTTGSTWMAEGGIAVP